MTIQTSCRSSLLKGDASQATQAHETGERIGIPWWKWDVEENGDLTHKLDETAGKVSPGQEKPLNKFLGVVMEAYELLEKEKMAEPGYQLPVKAQPLTTLYMYNLDQL